MILHEKAWVVNAMMASFCDVFRKDPYENKQIPKEVIDSLNAKIPDCFSYVQHKGKVSIGLKDGIRTFIRDVKFRNETEEDRRLAERLSALPTNTYAEYLYRVQRSIPVEKVRIGSHDTKVPLEKLIGDPLSDEEFTLNDCRMYPGEFPEATTVLFETKEGRSASIWFRQQAYDSFTEVLFENVDFPTLEMKVYVYSPLKSQTLKEDRDNAKTDAEHPVCFSCTVAPVKAVATEEALTALCITKGIIDGSVKINGREAGSDLKVTDVGLEKVEEDIAFWETAASLERKLGVRFNPGTDFSVEDQRLFAELDLCLNRQQRISWKHPFRSFHVSDLKPCSGFENLGSLIRKEKLTITSKEGPIPCTLLGAEFDIYSDTKMSNFVITSIDWDDEAKLSGEVHITDPPGETWVLERLYKTQPDDSPDREDPPRDGEL